MEDVSVRVDKLGRILLPAGVRRAAGFEPDARLLATELIRNRRSEAQRNPSNVLKIKHSSLTYLFIWHS